MTSDEASLSGPKQRMRGAAARAGERLEPARDRLATGVRRLGEGLRPLGAALRPLGAALFGPLLGAYARRAGDGFEPAPRSPAGRRRRLARRRASARPPRERAAIVRAGARP